ncbi:MAG: hydrogenase iron-sulfur subunit [Anaerolinea sp.]|nr:hydrogenase iron-sulfur subunit [Anaerolinea sp.]
MDKNQTNPAKILILATLSGGYRGADGVGQLHADYPPNTYILPVVCPSMFREEFYLKAFERGVDAIIVMFSGSDCPYKDGASKTADIVNRTYPLMKELGLEIDRLRLAAICTVCTTPFQREVKRMEEILDNIGPIERPFSLTPAVQLSTA